MAKVNYTVCDRCEAKSTQENVKISGFSFDKKTLDLCHECQDELKALFNHSIHARLLAGAKAEEVGDDRAGVVVRIWQILCEKSKKTSAGTFKWQA